MTRFFATKETGESAIFKQRIYFRQSEFWLVLYPSGLILSWEKLELVQTGGGSHVLLAYCFALCEGILACLVRAPCPAGPARTRLEMDKVQLCSWYEMLILSSQDCCED